VLIGKLRENVKKDELRERPKLRKKNVNIENCVPHLSS